MTEKLWRYDIQHGPEGEANYAWVYCGQDMIATMKTHSAKEICDRMNTPAPAVNVASVAAHIAAWIEPQRSDIPMHGWEAAAAIRVEFVTAPAVNVGAVEEIEARLDRLDALTQSAPQAAGETVAGKPVPSADVEVVERLQSYVRQALTDAAHVYRGQSGNISSSIFKTETIVSNAIADFFSGSPPLPNAERFNPATGSPATADQMAAIMLLHGTPKQKREALTPSPQPTPLPSSPLQIGDGGGE